MRKRLTNFILILIFLAGLSLLLYPSFSNWWNSWHQSRAIASYSEQVANMDEDKYNELWDAAIAYNESLLSRSNSYILTEEQLEEYTELLNVGGNGVMGYIDIPIIGVTLPIYHGTSDSVLQVAVGHLDWTSLPTGGESTHTVLSGHRGLPSARLFTDLDDLIVGDTFMLRILDEVLTYEVDKIRIVEPHVTEDLLIEEGKDYCTLVTCTPYGINSHRLLVRGHRIETAEEARVVRITADAVQIDPMIVAPVVAVPILLVLLIMLLLQGSGSKKKKKKKQGGDADAPKK